MLIDAEALSIGATKTASFTGTVGKVDLVDLSSVTADIAVTFPSSPNAGDMFGYIVIGVHSSGGTSTTSNDRPYFSVEPVNATSINGASYSSLSGSTGGGPLSLWSVGEKLIFMYTGSTWIILESKFVPHYCKVEITASQSVTSGSGPNILFTSTISDDLGLHSTTTNTDRVYVKRINKYNTFGSSAWSSNTTGQRQTQVIHSTLGGIFKDRRPSPGVVELALSGSTPISTAGTYFTLNVYQDSGSTLDVTASPTSLAIEERI